LQSQLASLTSNPYGDNPLFKNLLPDNNRREDIMKPTNPVAQKAALNSPQYKVSPHGLKAKVKPLTGQGSASKAGKKHYNSINDTSEVKNRFESNINYESRN
jgi:nuclear pore complex protein Nup98-Nup96